MADTTWADGLSRDKLRKMAKEKNIVGGQSMLKDTLIEALSIVVAAEATEEASKPTQAPPAAKPKIEDVQITVVESDLPRWWVPIDWPNSDPIEVEDHGHYVIRLLDGDTMDKVYLLDRFKSVPAPK